jgi:hypothetical protein
MARWQECFPFSLTLRNVQEYLSDRGWDDDSVQSYWDDYQDIGSLESLMIHSIESIDDVLRATECVDRIKHCGLPPATNAWSWPRPESWSTPGARSDITSRLIGFVKAFNRDSWEDVWVREELTTIIRTAYRFAHEPMSTFMKLPEASGSNNRLAYDWLYRLENSTHAEIGLLLALAPFWIRDPRTWEPPKERNLTPGSLKCLFIKHLLAEYELPAYLEHYLQGAPDRAHAKWMLWIIAFGQGASLYKLGNALGWHIPRRMPQHLYQVDPKSSPVEACQQAEVYRLGGGWNEFCLLHGHDAYSIDPTQRQPAYELEFWQDTVRWIVKHFDEMADLPVFRVLDWGRHMFLVARQAGQRFSWCGRSLAGCIEKALEYARQLERAEGPKRSWPSHGWDWDCTSPEGDWEFRELLSSDALQREGTRMQHCVASYAIVCHSQQSAIFSVRLRGAGILTIQVDPHSKRIIQCHGHRNRNATPAEKQVVNLWYRKVVCRKTYE